MHKKFTSRNIHGLSSEQVSVIPDKQPVTPPTPKRFFRANDIDPMGVTGPNNTPYIRISTPGVNVVLPLADFTTGIALSNLTEKNVVFSKTEWASVRSSVDNVIEFPAEPLALRPGWLEKEYIQADGRAYASPGQQPPIPLFARARANQMAGTFASWKKGLIDGLVDEHLATFATMTSFVAPVMDIVGAGKNSGFRLVGSDGAALSLLEQLAASVVGCPLESPDGYAVSGRALGGKLEAMLDVHADAPLIIRDLDLLAANATERTRAGKFEHVFAALSDGAVNVNAGSGAGPAARFSYLATWNAPAASLMMPAPASTPKIAINGLFTLSVDTGGLGKLFDPTLTGDDIADQRRNLRAVTAANYGWAMARFLERLVCDRGSDEAALRAWLVKHIARFKKRVGADGADPVGTRAADAFALVCAAGLLAKKYGALPGALQCRAAAMACFDANRASIAGQSPFLERLKRLAADSKAKRIVGDKLEKVSDAALAAFPAMLRANPRGRDELLLTQAAFARAFPNGKLFFADQGVRTVMQREDGRRTVKRGVRRGKSAERVYCFKLP